MTNVPPPYAPREHAQVVSAPPPAQAGPSSALEFAETTSVTLEWRLTGLRAMYDSSKGEAKSKCIKSAIFGDADNLWEVLWYPNSGVAGGEFASLYLSCVPTPAERDQALNSKWSRKGLWWFRFEIKSLVPDERTSKIITLATKDASDHTFAVKTANWGWQQFAKRDSLFLQPAVVAADGFVIQCTIQAQPQPPAGFWLGMGIPPTNQFITPNLVVGNKMVGSGGGLSAWSGGEGASGGVAGGTTAGGGPRKVVPRDLVSSIGSLLDDPLYSDIEFVFPRSKNEEQRKIFANRKILSRCEYFHSMFHHGFREGDDDSVVEDDDDDYDILSDSDVEDEINSPTQGPESTVSSANATIPGSSTGLANRRPSTSADVPLEDPEDLEHRDHTNNPLDGSISTEGNTEEQEDVEVPTKREALNGTPAAGPSAAAAAAGGNTGLRPARELTGPKKTKVVIVDAAWSTWWAVLYWLYTDLIIFAPLSSTFDPTSTSARHANAHARGSSISSSSLEIRSRRDWIRIWMEEHNDGVSVGPRPVSAKAVYRLADKLDLPSLKLRAFQHISSGLTAQNIPAEVFSRFSSTFEDVRKVQVAFFLKHWTEIKKSETMMQIWQQIRVGKHVGFEEVWPLIVGQLDFRPS